MYIPKKYGQSKAYLCPFCRKDSTIKNKQQIPVCYSHKNYILQDLTCFCGDYLELREGKFGIYFNCTNCGNINIDKALKMNPDLGNNIKKEAKTVSKKDVKPKEKKVRKEITITSDEVDVKYS